MLVLEHGPLNSLIVTIGDASSGGSALKPLATATIANYRRERIVKMAALVESPAPVERDAVQAPADAPGSLADESSRRSGGTPLACSIPVEREEGMWERACESVDAAMAESEHMWVLKMLYFARAEVVRELRSAIRTIDRRLFPVTKTMDEVSCVVAWLERHTEAIEKGEGGA